MDYTYEHDEVLHYIIWAALVSRRRPSGPPLPTRAATPFFNHQDVLVK